MGPEAEHQPGTQSELGWTAAQLEFTWMDQQNFLCATAAARAEFTEQETQALHDAEAAIEEASQALDDPAIDGERRRELWAAVTQEQRRYAEIERARADPETGVQGRFRATPEVL